MSLSTVLEPQTKSAIDLNMEEKTERKHLAFHKVTLALLD